MSSTEQLVARSYQHLWEASEGNLELFVESAEESEHFFFLLVIMSWRGMRFAAELPVRSVAVHDWAGPDVHEQVWGLVMRLLMAMLDHTGGALEVLKGRKDVTP